MGWLEWELIWVRVVALPDGMGQVLEQRDLWSHVKHLPCGLWESVPQQESRQDGPNGGRQAGKAP